MISLMVKMEVREKEKGKEGRVRNLKLTIQSEPNQTNEETKASETVLTYRHQLQNLEKVKDIKEGFAKVGEKVKILMKRHLNTFAQTQNRKIEEQEDR